MPYLSSMGCPMCNQMFLLFFVLLLLQLYWMLSEKFCKTKECSCFLKWLIWYKYRKDRKPKVPLMMNHNSVYCGALPTWALLKKMFFINCCRCFISSKFFVWMCLRKDWIWHCHDLSDMVILSQRLDSMISRGFFQPHLFWESVTILDKDVWKIEIKCN